jgi:hypothetical protein
MSLSSPNRLDRLRAAFLLLVLVLVQGFGPAPAAAAAATLPVIAVLPGAERTSLVVDLSAAPGPVRAGAASVTVDGAPQQAQVTPVVSDQLAVALVVDASDQGRDVLPAWLSAAARFILEVPAKTFAVAVTDTSPPVVLTTAQGDRAGVVRALSAVRAGGVRHTSDAVSLATRQFPAATAGARVLVLYTTAADAGGESAAALGARLAKDGTILVVVGTADGSTYWADATRATGGFFAPAATPVVVPALDQVETTLRGRHLVQFPTPRTRPARVTVQINTGGLRLTGGTVIPGNRRGGPPVVVWWAAVAGAVAVLLAAAVIVARRVRRRPAALVPAPAPAVVRARASLPSVARGRAPVPVTPRGRTDPDDPPPEPVSPAGRRGALTPPGRRAGAQPDKDAPAAAGADGDDGGG